jgi:hypothetical protein
LFNNPATGAKAICQINLNPNFLAFKNQVKRQSSFLILTNYLNFGCTLGNNYISDLMFSGSFCMNGVTEVIVLIQNLKTGHAILRAIPMTECEK